MHADETPHLNPYAPSMVSSEAATGDDDDSFPEYGIPFSGVIDLPLVRHTRKVSLVTGVILALSFIGILMAGALLASNEWSLAVLTSSAVITGFALWFFIPSQTDRPLLKFNWMQGVTSGLLRKQRLDIRWNGGESEGSFLFPQTGTELEFLNRRGRLFMIRKIPCFIPRQAVAEGLWSHVKGFRAEHVQGKSQQLLNPPLDPSAEPAIVWGAADASFFFDRKKHDFICAAPLRSRWVFVLSVIILGLLLRLPQTGERANAIIVVGMAMFFSGVLWLSVEWRRRDWGSPALPSLRPPKLTEPGPNYQRWIDGNRLLVGYHDAWICVPWEAVQQAVVSPYGIQFSFTPLELDAWFLERGTFREDDWQAIVGHVCSRTNTVVAWGSLRRFVGKAVKRDV